MGLLTPPRILAQPAAVDLPGVHPAVEAAMVSQGLRLRVGPHPDDLCPIEELSMGDPVWDLATHRLVDLEGMSCMTLDAAALQELGYRAIGMHGLHGPAYLALASARITTNAPRGDASFGPTAFFRIWPETRLVAELEGQAVLFRQAL